MNNLLWHELYGKENEPSENQISGFINSPLWDDLNGWLKREYHTQPKMFYSGCSMGNGNWMGWNAKYKKSGKVLCSIYPKQGYFSALLNIGSKQEAEADALIPLCTGYIQDLYRNTQSGYNGKSLAVQVTDESILRDLKNLISIRAKT